MVSQLVQLAANLTEGRQTALPLGLGCIKITRKPVRHPLGIGHFAITGAALILGHLLLRVKAVVIPLGVLEIRAKGVPVILIDTSLPV